MSFNKYHLIAIAFCIIVTTSNTISSKMVLLPFFENFSIPAGLLFYPLTFFLSDLVTEVYGAKPAKHMVYLGFAMSILSFFVIKLALLAPSPSVENQRHFHVVFSLNGTILIASLSAYIASQTIDIQIYTTIKSWTGIPYLWLRNNGSTLIAQAFDTSIVNFIHLYLGAGMALSEVGSIALFSYLYKCSISILLTPLFYLFVSLFKSQSHSRLGT